MAKKLAALMALVAVLGLYGVLIAHPGGGEPAPGATPERLMFSMASERMKVDFHGALVDASRSPAITRASLFTVHDTKTGKDVMLVVASNGVSAVPMGN